MSVDTTTPQHPGGIDPTVYVQMRSRPATTASCVVKLQTLITRSTAEVRIAGLARDTCGDRITVAVALGPFEGVTRRSAQSVAAWQFTYKLFGVMSDYLPCFRTDAPSADERLLASRYVAALSALPAPAGRSAQPAEFTDPVDTVDSQPVPVSV